MATLPAGDKWGLYRIKWITYRVLKDTDDDPERGTLVRTEFGNHGAGMPQITDTPIAYNVTDFDVQYVLTDGRVVNNTFGLDADDEPIDVYTVSQVVVTVRTTSSAVELRSKEHITMTLTSTFNTRNLGYDTR